MCLGGGDDLSSAAVAAIVPCIAGKELVLVKHPDHLCGGRIGRNGKVCLKSLGNCDTESHERSKGELPLESFLILKESKDSGDRGYEGVVLEIAALDYTLVLALMDRTGVNWATEFEQIRSSGTTSIQGCDLTKSILKTARKQTYFNTPAKSLAVKDNLAKIADLETITDLVEDMTLDKVDKDGEKVPRDWSSLQDPTLEVVLEDVYARCEVLAEHAAQVKSLMINQTSMIESYVKPVELSLSGVKVDLASVRGDIGTKDLTKSKVPQGIWTAVETGFTQVDVLEKQLAIAKIDTVEALDGVSFLLDVHTSREVKTNAGDTVFTKLRRKGGDFNDSSSEDDSFVSKKQTRHSDTLNCDENAIACSMCMTRMGGIENRLVNALLRLSNLEETKSGTIEGAIMVKDEVFRGRDDLGAWCDKYFPEATARSHVECGCFVTPHYLLNLVTADMCSKRSAQLDLTVKELKTLGVSRPDATSYYALQTDKPDFMVATSCPAAHVLKVSKSVKDSAPIKFVPSFADFGTASDNNSLQYRFKQSLAHVIDKQEKYLEARMSGKGKETPLAVARQLLSDSEKFVTQMLGFMEELYSACNDSFGAASEAWELVCHCLEELFTKELKPSLKFCVEDLTETRSACIGVIHTAFSLNGKVRDLLHVGLQNHHSTTTSHVRFVMKMAKSQKKGSSEDSNNPLTQKYNTLKEDYTKLKEKSKKEAEKLSGLESRLDRLVGQVKSLGDKK